MEHLGQIQWKYTDPTCRISSKLSLRHATSSEPSRHTPGMFAAPEVRRDALLTSITQNSSYTLPTEELVSIAEFLRRPILGYELLKQSS
jgi:hypothetical protein